MKDVLSLRPRVYKFLLKLSRNPDVAEDLTQDTMVRAFKSISSLDIVRSTEPWLLQIAYRVFLDTKRTRRRRISTVSFDDFRTEDGVLVEFVDKNAATPFADTYKAELDAALSRLDKESRDLLTARADGECVASIAARTGIPEGSIKSKTYRTRAKVQKMLAGAR